MTAEQGVPQVHGTHYYAEPCAHPFVTAANRRLVWAGGRQFEA